MTLGALKAEVRKHGLIVMGVLPPQLCGEDGSLVLLGTGDGFWPIFSASEEKTDGQSDPLDRWSKRVIGKLATAHEATCSFPSDGPPYPPFIDWALKSGRFHSSPVGMMVHDRAGLMVSIRGALHFQLDLGVDAIFQPSPCDSCTDQPCRTTCPVDALGSQYDVLACKTWITTPEGSDCLTQGCLARRSCPVSQSHRRDPSQSAFHMEAFLRP